MTGKKKVVFATPSIAGPTAPYIESLKASLPLIVAAGWDEGYAQKVGCPYISCARADMLRMALDAKADVIVFLDYDLSWDAPDLLNLIETKGDVVSGTYRFKEENEAEPERYMGNWDMNPDWTPKIRESDGAISATLIPAGFLKITKEAVDKFMGEYPELSYGPRYSPTVDLFNHGARDRIWWGEDYSFAQRWKEKCGDIWLVPDLSINHHAADKVYPGNLHEFLMRQPGGSKAE
jgi:glycosyltransferase involved in cell wall biosynthesis